MTARVSLLDVNVLVALFDSGHPHHESAHRWLSTNRRSGWATCPLTENGVVRILANTAYSGTYEAPAAIRERLTEFCDSGNHEFFADSVSLRDTRLFDLGGPVTHRHLTDIYLLGLAKHHGGRLASFDRHIRLRAVVGADQKDLEVIRA